MSAFIASPLNARPRARKIDAMKPLFSLLLLFLLSSCAHRATPPPCDEDGPDTSRKFHPLHGPNFGPYP